MLLANTGSCVVKVRTWHGTVDSFNGFWFILYRNHWMIHDLFDDLFCTFMMLYIAACCYDSINMCCWYYRSVLIYVLRVEQVGFQYSDQLPWVLQVCYIWRMHCTHSYIHDTHMHVCACTHTHIYTQMHTHKRTHTNTHTQMHTHKCTHTNTHTQTCICTYT